MYKKVPIFRCTTPSTGKKVRRSRRWYIILAIHPIVQRYSSLMPCWSCKSVDGRRSCVRCACTNAGRPCCDCCPSRSSRCANCNDDGVSGIQPVSQSRFVERLSAPEGTTTTPDLTQRSYASAVSAFVSSPTSPGSSRLLRELPDSQLSSGQWRLFIKNGDWLTGLH